MYRVVVGFLVALLMGIPASAQSTWVGASLLGNVARTGSIESPSPFGGEPSLNGESLGGAVRLTRSFAERWGVELEFAIPAEIETDSSRQLSLFSELQVSPSVPGAVFLPIEYRVISRQQHMTIGATGWFRQPVGGRTWLIYSAGVSFLRLRQELEYALVTPPSFFTPSLPGLPPLTIPTPTLPNVTSITYSAGPLVDVDARISLSSRISLVPGIRLHGTRSGWLVRPGVGIGWQF